LTNRIVLCGPQGDSAAGALRELGITGPVAVVTAGWQEREGEPLELGAPAIDLGLHGRAADVFATDHELHEAYRARQTRLKLMQDFYRVRLDHTWSAQRAISVRSAPADLLAEEYLASLDLIRQIDRDHLARCRAVQQAFDAAWGADRPALARHTDELREQLAPTQALVIAGGHVAVIVNRLRLFGVLELAGDRPIIAWSAGAMALTERIVLFHDDPPHGQAISEVLDAGLGAISDLVVLPDARTRLRLGDTTRVGELAQRYAPASCIAMDRGSQIWIHDKRIARAVSAQRLETSGRVEAWQP
jgi:hypothetical protein